LVVFGLFLGRELLLFRRFLLRSGRLLGHRWLVGSLVFLFFFLRLICVLLLGSDSSRCLEHRRRGRGTRSFRDDRPLQQLDFVAFLQQKEPVGIASWGEV